MMPFREKSAWGMALVLIATVIAFIISNAQQFTEKAADQGALSLLPFVLLVVIGAIVLQAVLAGLNPAEASMEADERERIAIAQAGHWSGLALTAGIVLGILDQLWSNDPNRLLLFALGSVVFAQISEYALQIFLFRRGT